MNNILDKQFSFVYYQDQFFYYFWKPAGIASTRWKSASFLDLMCDDSINKAIQNIVQSQMIFFGKNQELWLLNRLDNATSWLLYFAKSPKVYNHFRNLQQNMEINKYYLLEVYGNVGTWIEQNWTYISYPIMHHKFSEDRMIVVKSEKDQNKWKWKMHNVKTEIVDYQFLEGKNRSVIVVKIHKWIRHQIRVHFSSIWYPICWDLLYCKNKLQSFNKLQLFSIWMDCDKL